MNGGESLINPFSASVIQSIVRVVRNAETKHEVISENLRRNMELVDYLAEDPLYCPKIAVFPEFFLTGVPEAVEGRKGRRLKDYQMISIEIPSEYTDILASKSSEHGIFIVGNSFEADKSWPDRVFNCTYVLDPQGKIALKYRKINDLAGRVANTNSPDVYSEYVKKYGTDSFFPVIDTVVGKLACMTCFDVYFPEVARILAMRGAEVIAMPTGEPYSLSNEMEVLRKARAIENNVYLLCANHGDTLGSPRPVNQQRGHSSILDYRGNVLQMIDGPGEAVTTASIDVESLRKFRKSTAGLNIVPQVKADFYSKFYTAADLWPTDAFLERPIGEKEDITKALAKVIQRWQTT